MLNVVARPDRWVCNWIADTLATRLVCETRDVPISNGTNIYVPYYMLQEKTEKDVALFTHYSMPETWDRAISLADVCIAMSEKTAEFLPKDKTIVVPIPPDPQFCKQRVVFGVAGRDYTQFGDSRKRIRWIDKLERMPGLEIRFTKGEVAWEYMPDWYAGIDYLLVLSDNEGGPMGVVEAIACGKPVIAPDVGWAWDYPVLRYDDWDGLEKIIKGLTTRPDAWDITAERIKSLC